MNCERVARENIVERYLAGTLEPGLKDAWEEHYFACERCTGLLETWQAIEKPLREAARPRALAGRRVWIGAALAAMLVLGIGVTVRRTTEQKGIGRDAPASAPQLDPPAYEAPAMRGIESKAEVHFREAMEAYQRREYGGAIQGLRAALELDPELDRARFFLGACYLLTGDTGNGVRELDRVAAGQSPFAGEAKTLLARAKSAK